MATSRDPLVQVEGFALHRLQIRGFYMDEGAAFLLSLLERPESAAAEDRTAATVIAKHFNGWPLGLHNAAMFMKKKRLTPARFVRLQSEKIGEVQKPHVPCDQSIIPDFCEMALGDIPNDARELLDFLSFLVPYNIPVDFVDSFTFQFLDAREWLSSRSIIEYDESENFASINCYLQSVWLTKLATQPERYRYVLGNVVNRLLEVVPEPNIVRTRDPELWKAQEMYITHVTHLVEGTHTQLTSSLVRQLLHLRVRAIQ